MGESIANRLWQWYGVEFPVLVVSIGLSLDLPGRLTNVTTRICLERTGVVQDSDHTALVIRVFWRRV